MTWTGAFIASNVINFTSLTTQKKREKVLASHVALCVGVFSVVFGDGDGEFHDEYLAQTFQILESVEV